MDLFAARINTEFLEYASFRLDPTSKAADSFPSLGLISLSMPFPLSVSYLVCCQKTKTKIRRDKARGVVVLPGWPNQPCGKSSKNVSKAACIGVCKKIKK